MRESESVVKHEWNTLGGLATSVLQKTAAAREVHVSQLREAEGRQGESALSRRATAARPPAASEGVDMAPRQLELPFV